LFNVELNTFRDWFWFDRVWGNVQDRKSITEVVLLLPKYKIERLRQLIADYKERFLEHSANAIFSVGELKTTVDRVQTRMSTGTGFAMFRFGHDPSVGELHPRSHIYIFSKPFSTPSEENMWNYKYALEINDHAISSSLEEVWNEHFDSEKLRKVADLVNDVIPTTTEEKERIIEPLIARPRLASDNAFETKLRIRAKLFHPNVPSYVLNQNYYLLDWNPAFEITFPTDRFCRGQSVREFLACLDNYEEILVKGQAFLNNPPLYHVEPFIYISPLYGRMAFTKMTSPVTDEQTGEVVGWNLVLNVDSVENSGLYAEHRKYATELDALITKYASAYDEITSRFQGYQELVELHCQAVKEAHNVLDVGAGPGGVTEKLLKDGKRVTAVDNNDEMLLLLRDRCRIPAYERTLTINKVNVEVLNGFEPTFDGAVLLHVLFTLAKPLNCLRKIYELLLPGSVLALSGPRKTAVLENLFEAIEDDARRYTDWSAGELAAWRSHLKVFREVNLKFREMGMISRYDIADITNMLTEAGFKVEDVKEGVYAKQGVFFVARKPLA
jgi:SAM-dependent methyltransferase